MNARLDVEDLLGLQTGEARIISNAGGVVTEDALRCLIITHHLLDTNEFILPTTPAAACSRSEPRPDVVQTAHNCGRRRCNCCPTASAGRRRLKE